MIEERRKHQRAKRHLPLKIEDRTFDAITETVDISPAGIYCRITRFLQPMSKVEVMFLLPYKNNGRKARKIRCRGVVVRSEPVILRDAEKAHYNIAIFFTEISEKDQKIIESYINSNNINEAKVSITG